MKAATAESLTSHSSSSSSFIFGRSSKQSGQPLHIALLLTGCGDLKSEYLNRQLVGLDESALAR
jgi:hypothetical protein